MTSSAILKIFLAILLCANAQIASAQLEIKSSPVLLLFELFNVSVEKPLGRDWGVEGDLWFVAEEGVYVTGSGKYYLNPRSGADAIYVGGFVGALEYTIGVGFLSGYKWVSQKNFIFEGALGIGRDFVGEVLPYGKLHIGWRIKGKKNRDRTPPSPER